MNGRELGAALYDAAVPLLGGLRHSAGLLGSGSEVLGFDDATSTDHHFGPRFLLFLDGSDIRRADNVRAALAAGLPPQIEGTWTSFTAPDPTDNNVQHPCDPGDGPINHRVEVFTVPGWTTAYLGFDATRPPTLADWMATPTQLLATVVDGAIYHDGLEALGPLQDRLRWYPDDVWRYVLGAQWRRISQEDHFVGRTASVGDDLGSRLLAARLVRDLVRLAFLIERRWAPYAKWLGSAFAQLPIAAQLHTPLADALAAPDYPARERALAAAYEIAMKATAELGLAEPFDTAPTEFYLRGFVVTFGTRIADALRAHITDADVLALHPYRGAVDQYVDSTDVLDGRRSAVLWPAPG
jgi:hypothetical protein